MEIWLDKIMLPVTPLFEIPYNNNNVEENLSEIGTINKAGNGGLRAVEIESFFPSKDYGFLENAGLIDPYTYVRIFEDLARKNNPIRLVITETSFNFEVLIESFTAGEGDGTGDVNYKLSLKEYRRVKAIERQMPGYSKKSDSSNLKRLTDSKAGTKNIRTVGKHDTEWTMAKKLTGNGENAKELLGKNNISSIRQGQVLKP